MAQFVNMFEVDLRKPTGPQPLRQMVAEGDAKGNRVGAIVTDGGAAVALGGSCVGKVVRADGATVPLTGTISGNTAYVVLDQASCAVEGPIQVAVCWVSGTNVTTLLVAYGTVVHTQTGNAVQPSTPIPDLAQLLAEIDEMREATAAAEAAAERSIAVQGILDDGSDLNDISADTIWGMSSGRTYAHKPPIVSGFVHTYVFSAGIIAQWAHELDYSKVYGRRLLAGIWSDWEPFNAEEWQEHAVVNMGVLPSGTNLNTITGNAIYGLGSQQTYTNKPDIESGFLHSFKFSDGFGTQFAHELNGSKVYARRLLSGSWSAWARIDTPRALQVYDHLGVVMPSVDDLDDIKETGMWGISSQISYAHCPIPSSGWLECYTFNQSNPAIYVQRVWSLFDTASFARYYINGTWSAWVSRDGRDINNVYYAFGDSTTYGQIGGGSGQSPYNYPACVGTLLKMTVKNKGVGSQGLIKDWDTIHTDFINGLDMSDAALISVGWAYNDGAYYSGMNFGAYDDTGSTTFIGKYFTIMKEFQQKCPTARIVLITGYGWPDGTVSPMTKPTLTEQFTHKYTFADGQKSIREMYDTLEEMCYLHGWGCINQAKGTPFNQWNVDEMIGDQIHPTNAGYIAYGNMIAARMSAIWGNLYKW